MIANNDPVILLLSRKPRGKSTKNNVMLNLAEPAINPEEHTNLSYTSKDVKQSA